MNNSLQENFNSAAEQGVREVKLLLDEDNKIVVADGQVSELMGCTPEQCVGRRIDDVLKISGEILFRAMRQRYPTGDFRFAATIARPEGTSKQVQAIVKAAGTNLAVVLHHNPMAYPDALLEEFRTKESYFKKALQAVKVGYWVWYPQTNHIIWSDMSYRLMGYAPGAFEPAMESFMSAIHPDDRAKVQQNVGMVMQQGSAPDLYYRFVHPDGTILHVWAHAQVVKDDQGQIAYLFGTVQDISRQKEYELALERAKNVAEQANLAKTQFLSRVSHEFRTPLNAVVGNAELLHMELTGEHQMQVDDLLDGCRQLESMLLDALDITSIDHIPLTTSMVDVARIVKGLPAQTRALAERYRVHVEIDLLDEKPLFVQADERRLQQILLNLVSNGIKYNKPDGSVKIAMRQRDGQLRIDVSDTGVGIAPENWTKIFSPFERISSSHNVIPGTGLGLTLSRELIKLLGGSIDMTSEVGVGSCFTVKLPL